MVASISARGGVQAALGYYSHLGRDDYYTRSGEPPGGWAGEGAARLSLTGPVTRSDFEAALQGIDPKTGERLAHLGGRAQQHAAGWDMTFSAPKSVSVMWALSEPGARPAIERAQQMGVAAATKYLEQTAAWARRGKGGAVREQTAGLMMATFDHHTSREPRTTKGRHVGRDRQPRTLQCAESCRGRVPGSACKRTGAAGPCDRTLCRELPRLANPAIS